MTGNAREPEDLHRCRNYLAIVISYADLLLQDLPDGDPRRGDVIEIREAGRAASDLLSKVFTLGAAQEPPA